MRTKGSHREMISENACSAKELSCDWVHEKPAAQRSVRTHSNSRNPALPSDSKKTTFQRNWHKIGPKIAIAMIERQFWR